MNFKNTCVFVVLSFLLMICSGCRKKISKYPVEMEGVWTCNHSECAWIFLDIKKNGKGEYGPANKCRGALANIKGRVRFTDEALHVGNAKFRFMAKPEYSEPGDSINLTYAQDKKIHYLAKMKLKESGIRGGQTYTFYKIKNY